MKTKNKRLIIIFSVICVIVFFSLFSSQIFKLKVVEVSFYDDNQKYISNIKNNKIFNTTEKINKIITTTKFDYGNLIFLVNKSTYVSSLEHNNPYLKLKNIEVKFPNKLVVNVIERKPVFYISTSINAYLLDADFKLLEIIKTNNNKVLNKLIEISILSTQGDKLNFFDFFDVLPSVYEAGQNLAENNKVLQSVLSLPIILNNFAVQNNILLRNFCNIINFTESLNSINLNITTLAPYGITLVVEDIFSDFNRKLNKLLNALTTLKGKEPIKCTYGSLKIDTAFNCYWNNL